MTLRRVRRPEQTGVYVELCFGCACLIPRDCPGYLEIRWNPEDPGRDLERGPVRTTRAQLCLACRGLLKASGGLVVKIGHVQVELVELEPVGKWATRGDKFLVVRGSRRRKA